MSGIFTAGFWRDALERAIKTAAQTVILVWGVGDQLLDLFAIDWQATWSFALGGFVLSILTSIISAPIGGQATGSVLEKQEPKGKHEA